MTVVHRILYPYLIEDLAHYLRARGGQGLVAARAMGPDQVIEVIAESGLRGRGGAGFPTGVKWSTVRSHSSDTLPASVVVNGAEGEPGTIKDRTILANDPYQVIEGALIAAHAVGAHEVVIAVKKKEAAVVERVRAAVAEVVAAGWADGVSLEVGEGPEEYLYGEETALLEVLDGRYPFPRVNPPWRRGLDELIESGVEVSIHSNVSARREMAGPTDAPPTLVNNVETIANVAHILARGAHWFRNDGTEQTPGTFVCTISGDVVNARCAEVLAGTTLREAIEEVGSGVARGRTIKAVLSGVANKVITADLLDTPLTYEDMRPLGIGPGSAGFIVFDDNADMAAVAAGVSRFLATESCGQCTPCKHDGLTIASELALLVQDEAGGHDLDVVRHRLDTVANGARCFLASQHEVCVGSILDAFPDDVAVHRERSVPARDPALVTELLSVAGGESAWDEGFLTKQPDWTHEATWGGAVPADRYRDQLPPD